MIFKIKAVSDELMHESETIMQIVREHPELAPMYQKRMTEITQELTTLMFIAEAIAAKQQMGE